ncbi:hypothetical protein PspLS_07740 [Pyricularia sp. CBS 133598]|nr:hypothetical protein PspLS_07740 [Pyricularia sp. CBS 133598]
MESPAVPMTMQGPLITPPTQTGKAIDEGPGKAADNVLLLVWEAPGMGVAVFGVDIESSTVEVKGPGEKVDTLPVVPMTTQGPPMSPPLQIESALDVASAVLVALVQIGLVVGVEVEIPREPDKMQGPLIDPPVHHGSAEEVGMSVDSVNVSSDRVDEVAPVVAGNAGGVDVAVPAIPLTMQGPLISPPVQTGILLAEGKRDDETGRLSAVVITVEFNAEDVAVDGRVEVVTEPLTTQGALVSPPVQIGCTSDTDVLTGGLLLVMVVLVVKGPALELEPSTGDTNDVERPAVPLTRHGPLITSPVQNGRGLDREGTAVGAIKEVAFIEESDGDKVDMPAVPLTIQGPSITLPVHQGKGRVDAELELFVAMAVPVVFTDTGGLIAVDIELEDGVVDSTAEDVVDRRGVDVESPNVPLIIQGPLIIPPVHIGRGFSVGDALNFGLVVDITAVVLFVQEGSLVDVETPEVPITRQGPSMITPVQYGSEADVVVMLLLLLLPSGSVIGPPVQSGSDDEEAELFVGSGRTLHGSDGPPVQIGKVEDAAVVTSVVVCKAVEVDGVSNDETRQGPVIRPPVHMVNRVVTAQDPLVAPDVHGGREVLKASVADVCLANAVEVVLEALALNERDVLIASVNEVSIGSGVLPMQDPELIPPVQAERDVAEVTVTFGATVELTLAVVAGQDLNSVPVASLKHFCHELVQKLMVLVHAPPFPLVVEGASSSAGVATDTLPRHRPSVPQPAEVCGVIVEVDEAVLACRVLPTGSAVDVVNPESGVLIDPLCSDIKLLLVASVTMLAEF